jgi:DNA-binding SARP family transcriptional activator
MLDISLLGPMEVRVSGVAVSLSPLERNLLAVLTLAKGTVLSTEKIIDSLWADRHPAAPRSRVQGLISSLRRKVGDALVTRHPGYMFSSAEIAVDLDECEDLARRARHATTAAEVAAYLRQALDLWRGEPLDGVSAPGIEFDRVRLTELRVGLLEERFAADLELGHHAELIADLAALVSAHPLRERLAGQLMQALYRCNRQADALNVYQALRERLAEELGSDPCTDLRNLHTTILRGDPVSAVAAEPQVTDGRPAQLPASVGHFTGRDSELGLLTQAISRAMDEPRVLMVGGAGGIGKTALVVRWAHLIASRFPHGQIFIDLHGRSPRDALSARAALGVALAALGVPKVDMPETPDERASLYRTLISGRQVLVVADDADTLDQVLPLVPSTTSSQLVVTSRRGLVALAAHHAIQALYIEPLTTPATRDLLTRIVGPERMREPAAEQVVLWCGGWPLVTRIAGTSLVARPWQSMSGFVDELDDFTDLVLEGDPRSVRDALVGAYATLSPAAAYLFGRLGLNPSPSLTLHHLAPTDPLLRRVRRLLDELGAAHLVVQVGPDRYRVHDVVRRFARQCAAEQADRDAVDEVVGHARMADLHRI